MRAKDKYDVSQDDRQAAIPRKILEEMAASAPEALEQVCEHASQFEQEEAEYSKDAPSSAELEQAALERDASDHDEEIRRSEMRENMRAAKLWSVGELLRNAVFERQFLIGPSLLPKHGRMLITGMSGTGKSTLTLYLAACLASRAPLFGITNRHKGADFGKPIFPIEDASTVLYIDYELPDDIRTHARLRPLMEQFPETQRNDIQEKLFFPPHPTLYRLHNQAGESTGKGSYDVLSQLVADVRPDVLILDPLSSTHSLDENNIAIKQALNNVDRLIDLHGCAAIIVHHSSTKTKLDGWGKPIAKSTIEEPRGHSSLMDWCDVHMHFAQEEQQKDADADDEDDENEDAAAHSKTIAMTFGKARYCRRPEKRRLEVDFEQMQVSARRKKKRCLRKTLGVSG